MSRIRLEPLSNADYPEIVRWVTTEEEMVQWAGACFAWPVTSDQIVRFFSQPRCHGYRAEKQVGGERLLVGQIGLRLHEHAKDRTGHVGPLIIAPAHRGQRLCIPVVNALARLGFEHFELHRLELNVFDCNHAAIRCYENCGFRREGHLRDVCHVAERYWSVVHMALLVDEWEQRGLRDEDLDSP